MKIQHNIAVFLISIFLTSTIFAQSHDTAKGPEPITMEKAGGPLVIPDVARDKVIGFALYTTDKGMLKLSAQLYPLQESESREVQLEIMDDGQWQKIATSVSRWNGWLATFRIEEWDQFPQLSIPVVTPGWFSLRRLDPP